MYVRRGARLVACSLLLRFGPALIRGPFVDHNPSVRVGTVACVSFRVPVCFHLVMRALLFGGRNLPLAIIVSGQVFGRRKIRCLISARGGRSRNVVFPPGSQLHLFVLVLLVLLVCAGMPRPGSLRAAVTVVGNVTVPEFFPGSSRVGVFHFGFGRVTLVVRVDIAGGGWVVGHVVVFVPARVLYGRVAMRLWTRTVPDNQSKLLCYGPLC